MKNVYLLLVMLGLVSGQVFAQTLKVGVLAPEGTGWAKNLKAMSSEVEKVTNGEVKFKIYFGGAQGDEPDVLRKIRIGQLHGGIFTGKTLGEVHGDVRMMELPFTFYGDREKALSVMKKLQPMFDEGLRKNKFENIGFFEIGLVYFVSKSKNQSLDSLKGLKIWSWEGDPIVNTMIQEMNLVSVPLPLPDVLSSLATGIIEAAYAPPLGILALQWNTKVKYLVDFPISYSTGAFLIGQETWKKISPANQTKIKEVATRYIDQINAQNAKDNIDALTAMKSLGIEFVKFSDKDIKTATTLRAKILSKLRGRLFSTEGLSKFEAALK